MENFLLFLQNAKHSTSNLEPYENIHIVMGNESCDLDSTISALALAYYLLNSQKDTSKSLIIPVMNVAAKYFPLRTETCYLLRECGIAVNDLVFKDNINFNELLKNKKIETSIVDHHVLAQQDKKLEKTVTQIFDHRPKNLQEICQNAGTEVTIRPVGSCSTLIAREIISLKSGILFKELCYLLYATIIYDTIGLDKSCGKTTDEDIFVVEELEKFLKPTQSRKDLFNLLWKVHNDISGLQTKDLLFRDLKVVQGIPIPGLPLLVENYLEQDDAFDSIESFSQDMNSSCVVLIGIDASNEVKRDIGIYSINPILRSILVDALKKHNSDLLLTEITCQNDNINCFRQGNIKLTRKYILPLVNSAAKTFRDLKQF